MLATSGGGTQQDPKFATRLAKATGADEILQKPIDNDVLLNAVATLVNGG